MLNLIKKDFLTISRDRSELISLFIMPLILISILGFALGGLISDGDDIDKIPTALVIENDRQGDIVRFEEALNEEGLPEEAIQQIIASVEEMEPETIFLDILADPYLDELMDLRMNYDGQQAEDALMSEEVAGIITIPEDFTYSTLRAFYLEEELESTIEVFVPNEEQIYANIIESVVSSFTDQYNLQLSIAQSTEGKVVESSIDEGNFGERIHLSTGRVITAFQYYTIGMAVMFALYIASTISSNAFKEKTSHVFARLMITGERPLRYLLSKGISAMFISFLQLMVLFGISTLIFQTFSGLSVVSWIDVSIVTLIFSMVIGSLASLLTAISLWANNDAVSGVFSGIIVSFFAFIGGSMVPVEQFSPIMRQLGDWTPNGALMTSYLQILQGFGLGDVLPMIYRVLGMTVVFIIVAVFIFPKRRLS